MFEIYNKKLIKNNKLPTLTEFYNFVSLESFGNLERIVKMSKKLKNKKVKVVKKSKYKFGDLGKAIYKYFDSKGLDNVTYAESLKIAISTCPHSAYNKFHYAWYKGKYRKLRGLAKVKKS